jgi:glycogen operon protein
MATLLLSQGTPMILMGDEVGRSQGGNNNAYCQDNATSWLEWDDIGPRDEAFMEFTRKVIALRKDRPLLRQTRFLHGDPVGNQKDVTWLRPDGKEMEQADWDNGLAKCFGIMLSSIEDATLLIIMNSHYEDVSVTLPNLGDASGWRLLVDTARGIVENGEAAVRPGATFPMPARALLLYEAER